MGIVEAENLAINLAPELIGQRVVMNCADWPAGDCRACASNYTPSWIDGGGPEPIVIFHEPPTVEVLCHELAHILPRRESIISKAGVSPEFQKILWQGSPKIGRDLEPWIGHCQAFIRRALHLLRRAELLGFDICLERAFVAGEHYGLSDDFAYKLRLGIEPEYMRRRSFAEIEAEPPPEPFTRLWEFDVQRFTDWKEGHGRN